MTAEIIETKDMDIAELKSKSVGELHELADYTFAREHALVADFLRANGIPVLDLAPSFANETDPTTLWVAPDDAHPNARAHRLIANYTLDFIASGRGS